MLDLVAQWPQEGYSRCQIRRLQAGRQPGTANFKGLSERPIMEADIASVKCKVVKICRDPGEIIEESRGKTDKICEVVDHSSVRFV